MAASLTLLLPLPRAAKFINYTDFNIVVITDTSPKTLPLQDGDRMHVSPPIELYLIDGNNNAYKNITPPPDGYTGHINIIRETGHYKVYENLSNTLIYPTVKNGWRLDVLPPSIPEEDKDTTQPVKNNSVVIFWLLVFIVFCVIFSQFITYVNNINKNESYKQMKMRSTF